MKELCRQRGIQLKELAQKELFTSKEQVPLNAIIVCKNKTYVAQTLSELKLLMNEIEREYVNH